MIFTISGRTTKNTLKSILVKLNEDYMINNDVMDDESKIELLENIVDLQAIINKMED